MDFTGLQRVLQGERLPLVVVDLDAFDRNVERVNRVLASGAPHLTLRVATKSIRVPALIDRVMRAGSRFSGLMCYSAEEAELLSAQGYDDLLVAYPTLQDSDLRTLRDLHQQGCTIRLVIDDLEAARRVDRFMAGETGDPSAPVNRPFELVLEIDLALRLFGGRAHLGARRSPLRSVEDVLRVFEQARTLKSARLVGLMGYESQVAGLGDKNPVNRFLNPVIRVIRRVSVKRMGRFRKNVAEALQAAGHELKIFNGAGTGSLSYAKDEAWLTELTAGSAFLAPHLFDHYSNLELEPAFYFALQVVRSPDRGWITCQGGGYIASGAPGWDKVPLPVWPQGSKLSPDEGCGEVQTPLKLGPGSSDERAPSMAFFRHAKGGELAERFEEYLLVSNGRIVDRARTYRGLGKCFF